MLNHKDGYSLIPLVLFAILGTSGQTLHCKSNKICDCSKMHSQIYCPSLRNQKYIISFLSEQNSEPHIQIHCHKSRLKAWEFNLLPKLDIAAVAKIEFWQCPVVTNMMEEVVRKLGINSTAVFSIKYSEFPNKTLNNNIISDMKDVRSILLQKNNLMHLEDDTFKNIEYLLEINLSHNKIVVLPNAFKNTPYVKILDLSYNFIKNIDKKTFTYTPQLVELNLNNNKLTGLNPNLFVNLKRLRRLNLKNNMLRKLNENIFLQNSKLEILYLSSNPQLTLPEFVFSSLRNIKIIQISSCGLLELPPKLFENCTNLTQLNLHNNALSNLPTDIFKNLINLQHLDLSYNKISKIKDHFQNLTNLEELDLLHNNLVFLPKNAFAKLVNLKFLNLNHNKINNIETGAFQKNINLLSLDLSFNDLTSQQIEGSFDNCLLLEELFLGNNNLTIIPSHAKNLMLQVLDLNSNQISKLTVFSKNMNIDLTNNKIINCDCQTFDYVASKNLKVDDISCTLFDPNSFLPIKVLKPETFTCETNENNCPNNCMCYFRPWDKSIIIDCSYKGLYEIPKLEKFISNVNYNQTEVHLEGNNLEEGPDENMGFQNVTRLFFHNNRLKRLPWTPPKIKVLYLHDNYLSNLNIGVINRLNSSTSLENLTLHKNKWICDCYTTSLVRFLMDRGNQVDVANITCDGTKTLLVNFDVDKTCKFVPIEVPLIIFLLLFLICCIVATCPWYKKKQNKIYDVFVSYCYKDEVFVIERLLLFLENKCNLKVCIHYRDWKAGEFIPKQIVESCYNSKSILVVVSNDFLKSIWATMELRTAHVYAVKENSIKPIIVLLEDVDMKNATVELKKYLKSGNFIKSSDPMFWEKLENVLPSSKQIV